MKQLWLPWQGRGGLVFKVSQKLETVSFNRSEQDEFISSIEGPDLQQQLRWLRYLERLNAGAWRDHIAVQRLADMLRVDIHIISTINPDMELIRTSHHWSHTPGLDWSISLPSSCKDRRTS